jgi:predicted ATPase
MTNNSFVTGNIIFNTPVTFIIDENGTSKTTLLKALANKCDNHICQALERIRFNYNSQENHL